MFSSLEGCNLASFSCPPGPQVHFAKLLSSQSTQCAQLSGVTGKYRTFLVLLLDLRSVHISRLLKFLWMKFLHPPVYWPLPPSLIFSANLLGVYSLQLFKSLEKTFIDSTVPSTDSWGTLLGPHCQLPFILLIATLWACPANFPLIAHVSKLNFTNLTKGYLGTSCQKHCWDIKINWMSYKSTEKETLVEGLGMCKPNSVIRESYRIWGQMINFEGNLPASETITWSLCF